jgi:hypothetical protein
MNCCRLCIAFLAVCHWDNIPEKLWRGELNVDADEFREDDREYFDNPAPKFEFVVYCFDLVAQ